MNLNTSITKLKGVGDKTAKLFEKLQIVSYEDLLEYYPRDYEIFDPPVNLAEIVPERVQAVRGSVASIKGPIKAGRYTLISVVLKEGLHNLELTFFNQPYIKKMIKPGGFYIFRGKVTQKGSRLVMSGPKMYKPEDYEDLMICPVPVYHLTSGLSNKTVSKTVSLMLRDVEWPDEVFDTKILKEFDLLSYKDALTAIHLPDSIEDIAKARRRLAFEEFFFFLLLLRKNKELSTSLKNAFPMIETADTKRFIEALPFNLTSGQKKTWKQISDELSSDNCMNRLVQGDVGSGKTIVAVLALLMAIGNGYQGAMMAPTEVLATQHLQTIKEYVKKYNLPFKPVLLVGSLKAYEKKEVYRQIESGEANLVIGTHALIQDKVVYKNLAVVVTDEQHRFGVRQREALAGKSNQPHVLVMSATPIPRTLAIILYGDLQLSAIHDMPADRLPIKNCVVGTDYRPSAYKFISNQVKDGRQAYVICSQVEAGENDDLENVIDYTDKLRDELPGLSIEYLHGKMKASEKNNIMDAFANKKIDVLVSTTVIEVGINVPNATVMMVENSERFGLAQLHQLRGRVGRGKHQSYCIFVTSSKDEKTMERLNILNNSNDGFEIASADLKLRGPGELFGVRQSGEFAFKIADIYADSELLEKTSNLVDGLISKDPHLKSDDLKLIKEKAEKYFERSDMLQSI